MKVWIAAWALLSASPGVALALERAFWAEEHSERFNPRAADDLRAAGVTTVFWPLGGLECSAGSWRWIRWPFWPGKWPEAIRMVPVVAMSSKTADPFGPDQLDTLLNRMKAATANAGAEAMLVDYDAPERLFEGYAQALGKIRGSVRHLAVTARPDWIAQPGFQAIASAVDELVVHPEPPPDDRADALAPHSDAARIAETVAAWKSCPKPWRLGLRWSPRATVYSATGKPREDLRNWSWDDFSFPRMLEPVGSPAPGLAVLRATLAHVVGRIPLDADERVVLRWPSTDALRDIEKLAPDRGVVYFDLPSPPLPVAWSIRHLKAIDRPTDARISLRRGAGLILANESDADLAPNVPGGYALEIEADDTAFAEAYSGDFLNLSSFGEPSALARGRTMKGLPRSNRLVLVPVPNAYRLRFEFSRLPAGESLQVTRLRLSPGATFEQLRFRLVNVPGDPGWRPIP
jgi:hypothetical protein